MLKAVSSIKFAEIEAIKKRFLMVNRERLRRAEECMRPNQRDFLDFLPMLFHINHPSLPGYVAKRTPAGICDYAPSQRALKAAKKYTHRFDYKRRAMPRYDIVSMFLMGSSGTVAYSKKSDFDIWLCHQHGLSEQALADLQAKATAIEQWADGQGLEVHFFLMDPQRFKAGKIVDLSSESSGSAQYYLLLEEFYRTGLLLAGRYPIWWLVPVEEEDRYDEYVSGLFRRRLVSEGECVDFGGIPTLPPEEFFGAALWQLFKGIDSPYKSVLKLLLMEVYAAEYPAIDLLCLRFKRSIYDRELDLDHLDPYLMLYRKLEEYLIKRGEEERLELVRRCFYFKANPRLSAPAPQEYDWRRDLMRSLTNSWGWDEFYLGMMDDRANWTIIQVMKERGVLVRELTYTYQFLSDFARAHAQLVAINQHDLNALGRKLYAAFERKSGKVEIVNRGISRNVWVANIIFYALRQKSSEGGWAVLAEGVRDGDADNRVALKRTRSLVEAMSWAHFNGVIDGDSNLKLAGNGVEVESRELREIERSLMKVVPQRMVLETRMGDLAKAVAVVNSTVIVNLGVDPLLHHQRDGKHLASNRTDAFSYGGMYECLVKTFDQILITSWKEVITAHYSGIEGILEGISNYVQWMAPSKGEPPPVPVVLCFSSNHKTTIRQRVEQLYSDVINCFYAGTDRLRRCYIFAVEHKYYALFVVDDMLQYTRLESLNALMGFLGAGRKSFGKVVIDRYALGDTQLPLMFKLNKAGVIQLFFKDNGGTEEVYVIDERGSLFYQKTEFKDSDHLLTHYKNFFDAVLQRRYYHQVGYLDDDAEVSHVEYYRMGRNSQGHWQAKRCDPAITVHRGHFNIQVLADEFADEPGAFTVYCEDQEFSSLEHGDQVYRKVVSYILSRRRNCQFYQIFITDLDVPSSVSAHYPNGLAPTVEHLRYKLKIETLLNNALLGLVSDEKVASIRQG